VRAILLQVVWASVLVMTDTYRGLFTRVVYTEWIFFALLAIGVVTLRRRPSYTPLFRMPAAPWLSGLFVVACIGILINQVATDPINSAIGLAAVAIGLPAYYLAQGVRSARTEGASTP
jgi:APA family basic amino acid/polyamine antiporter